MKRENRSLHKSIPDYEIDQRVVESAPNGMILVGREGKITLVNSQIEKFFGYTREELLGQTIEMLVPERFRQKHRGYSDSFFADPKARPMGAGRDLLGLKKDGTEVPIEIGLSPIETPEGLFTLASIIDITERKRAEEELRQTNERLKGLDQLKSEVVSTGSHEIRTPLAIIQESLSLLFEGAVGPVQREQKEYLGMAQANIERLSRLINDVLDYQKLEGGFEEFHRAPHDLNQIIQEVSKGFAKVAAKKGPRIRTRLAEKLPLINFDRDKIIQVLTNFLSNALKFTEKGGITVVSERGENWVRVSVRDEGPGIPKEDQAKLFQSFNQLKTKGARKRGGTGLGLAISRKIIEAHGGRIGVESAPGKKGSVFSFILPIQDRRTAQEWRKKS